ncbi:hypothetical protein EBU99_05005 [bacterium]|nr:hypothetical protein [bacterium]
MFKRIAMVVLCTRLFGVGQAFAEPSKSNYNKDASQFCFPKLSAQDQIKYYSRVVNVGASYTHGCIGCDQTDKLRSYTDLTADNLWFRRNYLVQFLANVQWKQPGYGVAERIAILENDAKNRPSALIPTWSLQRDGYTGEWIYDPIRDTAHLTAPNFSKWLMENTGYGEAAALVGGAENVKTLSTPRNSQRKGHIYQTFRTSGGQDPQAPRVLDLALDGGRMHDFFEAYVSPEIMVPLQKSKWTDPELRKRAVEQAIRYVKSTNPSMIMAIDALFWDSVSHALAYMRESRPKSLIVRTLLNLMALTDKNGTTFNEVRRFNVSEDFYKVLRGISSDTADGPAVPILMARLINDPLEVFAQKKYEPVLGAVFGQYIETMTGQNFAEQLAVWLRKVSYSENPNAVLSAAERGWTAGTLKTAAADERVERTGQFYDEETDTVFTAAEVEDIRDAYEEYERILNSALSEYGLLSKSLSGQANQSQNTARVKKQSGLVAALANWALLKAIKDLPLFMESLEKAMQYENRNARAFSSLASNNTHLINVDKFFENFPYFLKPETMHPSVFGAKQMAGMINKAVALSL